MRGIGKGQTIVLFVIPEVAKLVSTESGRARPESAERRAKRLGGLSAADAARASLVDVSAWLLVNSMSTEKVQFELWTLQCARNVWRKRSMASLHGAHGRFGEHSAAKSTDADWAERRAHRLTRVTVCPLPRSRHVSSRPATWHRLTRPRAGAPSTCSASR